VGEGKDKKDVLSRLLKDRILLLGTDVNDEIANVLVAQLLYLASVDPDKEITLYINSPGGSVSAGMAIYDTMQFVPCDIRTICFGMAASMGAFLLGAGTPGKRSSMPNARIMIHQPLGGAQGQAADIEIQAKEILYIKARLTQFMAKYTNQVQREAACRQPARARCTRPSGTPLTTSVHSLERARCFTFMSAKNFILSGRARCALGLLVGVLVGVAAGGKAGGGHGPRLFHDPRRSPAVRYH
jgi:ATP-dependent Clp endopeptidase proteolytic subunit ClpP